ncbi:MAG: hypothetical protein K2H03_04215 [Muribaculaceae bacterium]|nr:hypothetical protein [Muribaculaceae bacterium]
MGMNQNDINDNEIRIISACEPKIGDEKKRSLRLWFHIILSIMALGCLALIYTQSKETVENDGLIEVRQAAAEKRLPPGGDESNAGGKSYTSALDTTIDNKGLLILTPENARPRLIIGTESLSDSKIILAAQAADVRSDNGRIAGTFVLDGELVSKGEAKAGYCSIVNGEITIGVADASPMLEQTLTEGGYFFRQYPLVAGGQIVENKSKKKAIRKALAEAGGKMSVVASKERLSFDDFSQLLIDAGFRNAIYLVGSSAHGFYVDENNDMFTIGNAPWNDVEYVNYIIWEQE